jgi:hypothetical protein
MPSWMENYLYSAFDYCWKSGRICSFSVGFSTKAKGPNWFLISIGGFSVLTGSGGWGHSTIDYVNL